MALRCVAMIAACPFPTGQGTQALVGELARGLCARGHRVHLVCYAHAAFERAEPFRIHRIPGLPGYRRLRSGPDPVKPLLDLALAALAVRVVRDQGCELVHAHNYEGALAGWWAARLNGRALVYHAHNLMEPELPGYFTSSGPAAAARLVGAGLDRLVPRLADRVIALHAPLADALRARGVAPDKLSVVEPGIELDFWNQADPDPREPWSVAYCGNLDRYQNLELVFAAMRRVVGALPAARLVLATPNQAAEARRQVARAGAAGFTRVVAPADALATRAVLERCTLAVSARSEPSGFPVKNLNAAAAGVPLVACRGAAHGVEHAGTGWLVPNGDCEAMAAAIIRLLRDPELGSNLGREARARARARFGLERMCCQVEREWDRL